MNASFPRTARLTQRREYDHVFQAPERKSSDRCFTVLGRSCLQGGSARLGLVVAKRQIRRAHERNRVKRLVRETFRQLPQRGESALDIVVIARAAAQDADNAALCRTLRHHFQRIFP
ncbi:ribonuclease P protein component [uncultured Cardiobacterium sp.]|uniref:ribonuclease P protein component n=1 Tax=uncultured Cardiobacterium sp. TaxID=417619 RepID=UPI0026111587|nr:ribonuclease P protein component [uncultured Cardiobacterium sp.]